MRGTAGWGWLSYENQRGSLWAIYCIFSGINKVGSRRNCGDWSSKRRHRDVHERGTSAAEARRDKDWVNPLREIDYLPVGRLLGVTFCLRSGKDNAWLTIPWREIWKSWWWKRGERSEWESRGRRRTAAWPAMSSREHAYVMVPDKGRQRKNPDLAINNSSIGDTRTWKGRVKRPQMETEEKGQRTRRDNKTIRTSGRQLMASAVTSSFPLSPPFPILHRSKE